MWIAFQSLIIYGVLASNIHWGWSRNPYLVGLLGVGAAYIMTACIACWKD